MADRPTDPYAIAARVLAEPRRLSTVATRDMMAICHALVEAGQVPQISNELAATARELFREFDGFQAAAPGPDRMIALGRVEGALSTLKTCFEEEFPHAQD